MKELEKSVSRFLSGFQMEELTVVGEVIANFLSNRDEVFPRLWGVFFMRNKSDMNSDGVTAQQFGEIGDFFERCCDILIAAYDRAAREILG